MAESRPTAGVPGDSLASPGHYDAPSLGCQAKALAGPGDGPQESVDEGPQVLAQTRLGLPAGRATKLRVYSRR
jgi:hypothetical protein